jgi:hypothetical protein
VHHPKPIHCRSARSNHLKAVVERIGACLSKIEASHNLKSLEVIAQKIDWGSMNFELVAALQVAEQSIRRGVSEL